MLSCTKFQTLEVRRPHIGGVGGRSPNEIRFSAHRHRSVHPSYCQVSWCWRLKSLSQTCENLLPTGLLGRRHGWFRGVPVPLISCLCPLHDHWRRPTKAEGGHWIRGGVVATSLFTFMLSSSNLKQIFRSFHISISGLVCQRKHRSSL